MDISVKRTSSLEKSGVGVTYSGVILMDRIIEKNVAMERSPGQDLDRKTLQTEREYGK